MLNVVGEQELTAFARNNGELAAASNVNVWHWDYVQAGGKKSGDAENAVTNGADGYSDVPSEDCDDGLPV